jgi:hypothetical protein
MGPSGTQGVDRLPIQGTQLYRYTSHSDAIIRNATYVSMY